jgi:hypothetical protein
MSDDAAGINFSFGFNKADAYPKRISVPDFKTFQQFCFSKRSAIKGLYYICSSFSDGHRSKDSCESSSFLAFDFDGMPGMETYSQLRTHLIKFRGFGYTTSSHTEDSPRARTILEASREMTREERARVSMAIQAEIERDIKGIKFDQAVYRGEQPIFTPLFGATDFHFDGDVVDVDAYLKVAPKFVDTGSSTSKNFEHITSTDPLLLALKDKGMIKRELQNGRFAVVCPCSGDHTSESQETSTVYTLPKFNGFDFGNFTCLHDHCRERPQESFIEALGIDYGRARAKQTEVPNVDHTGFIAKQQQKQKAKEEHQKKESANPDNWLDPLDVFAEFPVPPLKREMMPGAIAEYAFDCGELIGVDPAMIAMPAIVSCAAAIHDGITIQPKRHERGWTESARLWCALVGAPSVKKTPAIKRATKELRKIDMKLHEHSMHELGKYEQALEQWDQAKKDARAKKVTFTAAKPDKPRRLRMVIEDVTVEALSEILKDNSRGVMGIMDELSGWFGAMDAYSGSKAASKDRAHWLESYNGGGRIIDRIGRGSLAVPNWSVSMVGGIQPDAIRRIAKGMVDDGLMQRFMVVLGSNSKEYDRPDDHNASEGYRRLVNTLHNIQPSEAPVRLSDEAHAVRESLDAYIVELIDASILSNSLKSHLGKWSGLFARLLLTYHVIECANTGTYPSAVEVSHATALKVDTLMRKFLLPHAVAYYTNVLGGSSEMEQVRQIAGLILSKNWEGFNMSLLTKNHYEWRNVDTWVRLRVLESLEEMGWVKAQHDRSMNLKKGAANWVVNPKVHAFFAARAKQEASRRAKVRETMLNLGGRDE